MRGIAMSLIAALSLAGCANTAQLSANTEATDFSLDPAAFHTEGVGFLTPVSATGQEANAYDTGRERPVSFGFVAGRAAANLVARIPLAEPMPDKAAAASLSR